MPADSSARFAVGVCCWTPPRPNAARTVQHPGYIHEILAHAGVPCALLTDETLPAALPLLRLLITVGETTLAEPSVMALGHWVESGGMWISFGGVCGLPEFFGVRVDPPSYSGWATGCSTLGEGYVSSGPVDHPIAAGLRVPLHFFNGVAVRATDGDVLAMVLDAHQRPTDRAGIVEKRRGAGRCALIAPDVTGTIVRVQQGTAIASDGIAAPDGTAPVCDEVWKSDDGCVLDWLGDRQPVPGVPGLSGFLEPVADRWRDLLLRTICHLASVGETALPLLWFYPRNLPALAHMSHDTDGNDTALANVLRTTLKDADLRTTWCTILPGYPKELLDAIRDDGHELAMHYDALDRPWSEEEFDAQWRELMALFDGRSIVTNKNHYLRWEGYIEFYEWCVRRGIRLDQSKGASKVGELGFNFGTCHLYRPVDRTGRCLDVWELPTPTQDLNVFAPDAAFAPLLDATLRHYGILHLLFHPAHVYRDEVTAAIRVAAEAARVAGLEWWTGEQLVAWEAARREIGWRKATVENGQLTIAFLPTQTLAGMTLLFRLPSARTVVVNGREVPHQTVERWGFTFQAVTFDAPAGEECHVRVHT